MTTTPRTWFITGVSSGLGRALAHEVLQRQDHVIGTVRQDADFDAFEQLAPGRARGLLLDVTDHEAATCAINGIEARGTALDVIVNNAGYGLVSGIEEAGMDEIRCQFEVNLFAPLALMQAVLPHMRRRRRGHIVNITSVSGLVGYPSLGIYTGSKFALEGISETLARELEPFGIRVTLVEPGGFRTDFAGRSRTESRCRIDAYDASVGACRRRLLEHAGKERGDPQRAAAAILTALDADQPPLRLLLGTDALTYVDRKITAQLSEIERWRHVSRATDYPNAVPD